MGSQADTSRPKHTRRRGACKECRSKKIRCDGASPCHSCEKALAPCIYLNTRRSQGSQGGSINSNSPSYNDTFQNVSSPLPTTEGLVTPASLDLFNFVYENPIQQRRSPEPNREDYSSRVVAQGTPRYFDDSFFGESYLATGSGEGLRSCMQDSILPRQTLQSTPGSNNNLSAFENSLNLAARRNSEVDSNNVTRNASQQGSLSFSLLDLGWQVFLEPLQTTPVSRVCDITAAIYASKLGSSRKQAAMRAIKTLLSSDCQISLPSFWKSGFDGKQPSSLDMASPKIGAWIHEAFQEPGGLNTFIKSQHVIQIHRAVLNPPERSVQPTELSLLLVTITWGALLDTEFNSSVKANLATAVEDMTKLLFRYTDSADKFLALVAMLCLAERINQKELHALIVGCAGIASSLKLQMRSVVHATCLSEEQAAQVRQAIRVLYCIDKSYALRWQTLPLVSKEALPVLDIPNDLILRDDTSAVSVELLHARMQYAHLCLHIAELRKAVDENTSNSFVERSIELAKALDDWHESIIENPFIASLEESRARRAKHQAFCLYHEALLHLVSICSSNQYNPLNPPHQEWEAIRRRSIREVVLSCSTIPSDDLLQDQNFMFTNVFAFCLLAQNSLLNQNTELRREDQALLCIASGFFARMRLLYPQSFVFEEVSNLLSIINHE